MEKTAENPLVDTTFSNGTRDLGISKLPEG